MNKITPTQRRPTLWLVAIIAFFLILWGSSCGRSSDVEVDRVRNTDVAVIKATPTAVVTELKVPRHTPAVVTATPTATANTPTPVVVTATATPTPTDTSLAPSDTPVFTATDTPAGPSATPLPTITPVPTFPAGTPIAAYPAAPLCLDTGEFHDVTKFHTLWDSVRGCHYENEHGVDPFTTQVAAAFPGFDLEAFLGGVQIGHSNPSSPAENVAKHGGMKWQVDLNIPCKSFESADFCITDAVVQYHWFGNAAIEMEARVHSLMALVRACDILSPTDCGTLAVIQHVDFGQRVSQYQGDLVPYPDNPDPAYAVNFGPYFTIDRFGTCSGCRPSLAYVVSHKANSNGIWTSKNTGSHPDLGSVLLSALIRNRDMYQLKDDADNEYPFTFGWLCSNDSGATYNSAACRYTNTTARVHELAGIVPASWDNLAGFDSNSVIGRITAQGYVTRFGNLTAAGTCAIPGAECFPIILDNFFVGKYGGALPGSKISNPTPLSNPSRNVWFCAGVVCAETDAGAVPSGWVGQVN